MSEKIKGADGKACWKGYRYAGTEDGKDKCVPVKERNVYRNKQLGLEIVESDTPFTIEESEYQGKDVKLDDPFRTPGGPRKFAVYTMGPNGKVVIVRFGEPNMEIKRDDPARRASFRARHGCDDPGPKYKAKYWSCYQWRAGAKVDS